MKFGLINYVESSNALSDHSYTGTSINGTAGESLVFGNLVYLKSDGKYWKAKADSTSTMPAVGIATGTISADASGTILVFGIIRDDSWSFTPGGQASASAGLLFVSDATAGAISQTKPTTSTHIVQCLGYAKTATILNVAIDETYIELT